MRMDQIMGQYDKFVSPGPGYHSFRLIFNGSGNKIAFPQKAGKPVSHGLDAFREAFNDNLAVRDVAFFIMDGGRGDIHPENIAVFSDMRHMVILS
jgi:hypothetical protein